MIETGRRREILLPHECEFKKYGNLLESSIPNKLTHCVGPSTGAFSGSSCTYVAVSRKKLSKRFRCNNADQQIDYSSYCVLTLDRECIAILSLDVF